MFCENCGVELKKGALFCQSCGAKVDEALVNADNSQEVNATYEVVDDQEEMREKKARKAAAAANSRKQKAGKKGKGKKAFFEDLQFDDAAYAQDVKQECESKLKRVQIGLIIAAVASILSFIDIKFFDGQGYALGFGFLLGIASYIVGGGIAAAFKMVWRVAWFGWIVVPVFPIDFLIFICAGVMAVFAFICFPIVFVFLNYLQVKRNYDDAEKYLSYYR